MRWLQRVYVLFFLGSKVLFRAVKVQNGVIQTEEVNERRQAGLSSLDGDVWHQLVQCSLSTAPPLVNQGLELRQIILGTETGNVGNLIKTFTFRGNPARLNSGWYLVPVHLNHLEPAQRLHLVFHLPPQAVSLLCEVFGRMTRRFGNGSRKTLAPWLLVSVYVNIGQGRWRVLNRLQGICWNLLAILVLHLLINTQAFGNRGGGRGEGAPRSLQPLPQGGAQLLVMLRRRCQLAFVLTGC